MKMMKKIAVALVCTALALFAVVPATADPIQYEFETITGWVFSAEQAAIESIAGRPSDAMPTPAGIRYFVPGFIRGRFTYDPDNAEPPVHFPPYFWSHRGAMKNWRSELEIAGNVVGTYSGDAGQVIVSDGDDAPGLPDDLVNVQMCGYCVNPVGFSVNGWQATNSSLVWAGEGFRTGIDLPAVLPPANAREPFPIITFYNPELDMNTSIASVAHNIWQIVDIDIKPDSDPNCFNINGHGVIPVAILGSPNLDVTYIEQGTLKFGGLEVGIRGNERPMCSMDDADGDGHLDLVCQFQDDSTAWAAGSDEATLTGNLINGGSIKGTDSICLKP
jgi:hypothetical protein